MFPFYDGYRLITHWKKTFQKVDFNTSWIRSRSQHPTDSLYPQLHIQPPELDGVSSYWMQCKWYPMFLILYDSSCIQSFPRKRNKKLLSEYFNTTSILTQGFCITILANIRMQVQMHWSTLAANMPQRNKWTGKET